MQQLLSVKTSLDSGAQQLEQNQDSLTCSPNQLEGHKVVVHATLDSQAKTAGMREFYFFNER